MTILLLFGLRSQPLRTAGALLEGRGHRCISVQSDTSVRLRERIGNEKPDVLLCAEQPLLPRKPFPVRTVFLAPDYFCSGRFSPNVVSQCIIPHEELAFDFITHGVREPSVHACGMPVPAAYLCPHTRTAALSSFGLSASRRVFLVLGDGVSLSVLKSLCAAAATFAPDANILLLGSDSARRQHWMSAFAQRTNVYISDMPSAFSRALSCADAVFVPPLPQIVCAAARQQKPIALLHCAARRMQRNAAFLDDHGAAFHGKTTADSVSYLSRLLESDRMRGNMLACQQKTILPDAETRLIALLES